MDTRYARQKLLPGFQQQRLTDAKVLVVGAGGLGASALQYLTAAGIGHLGIVEDDRVERSNLNRQVLFETSDIGRYKAEAACDALHDLNPEIQIELFRLRLTESNAASLITPFDLVIDATDNYAARATINRTCLKLGTPWVFAAARRWQAQVALFAPGLEAHNEGPCWQCLVADVPETTQNECADAGILGVTVGLAGLWQASAAIAHLLGQDEGFRGKLLLLDAQKPDSRFVTLPRDEHCPACGQGKAYG